MVIWASTLSRSFDICSSDRFKSVFICFVILSKDSVTLASPTPSSLIELMTWAVSAFIREALMMNLSPAVM